MCDFFHISCIICLNMSTLTRQNYLVNNVICLQNTSRLHTSKLSIDEVQPIGTIGQGYETIIIIGLTMCYTTIQLVITTCLYKKCKVSLIIWIWDIYLLQNNQQNIWVFLILVRILSMICSYTLWQYDIK